LENLVRVLADPKTTQGRAYVFGGIFKLIRAVRGTNWRTVVKDYVRLVKGFASSLGPDCPAPVIVQLPWRDDSIGLFRVQREQVFDVYLTTFLKSLDATIPNTIN
jgi:hypothetical protein